MQGRRKVSNIRKHRVHKRTANIYFLLLSFPNIKGEHASVPPVPMALIYLDRPFIISQGASCKLFKFLCNMSKQLEVLFLKYSCVKGRFLARP